MAHDAAALNIEPTAWDFDVAYWLDQARGMATLADLQKQAEQGASLFRIRAGTLCVGAFLLRVEHHAEGSQGVIVAAAAKHQGVDMIETVLPAIEALFVGCESIRYHTRNAALARRMSAKGYTGAEIVCVKKLKV